MLPSGEFMLTVPGTTNPTNDDLNSRNVEMVGLPS